MRLVTFDSASGAERLGALFDGDSQVADLAEAHRSRTGAISPHLVSMQALIEGGSEALDLAAAALEQARRASAGVAPRADIRLRAPIPRPVQMRDFLCFEQHLRNSFARALDLYTAGAANPKQARAELEASGRFSIPAVWYEIPIYYKCNRMAVIGPDEDVIWPRYAGVLDYRARVRGGNRGARR